jgi:hypothetical protein
MSCFCTYKTGVRVLKKKSDGKSSRWWQQSNMARSNRNKLTRQGQPKEY